MCDHVPQKGASLTVTKKNGETDTVRVVRVLWQDGEKAIVAVERVDTYGHRISDGASYRAGVTAPGGRRCPNCGSRECAKAWDPRDLCDED